MSQVSSRLRRNLYAQEHEEFRASFRAFLDEVVRGTYDQWERDGIIPRSMFERAGEAGFLAFEAPEEYGGAGVADFRFNAVINEECYARGYSSVSGGITLHNDICLPYFLAFATEEQRSRWLPGIVSGRLITAIAMTEPGVGSDLAGITTRAERNGDDYVVNGTKTFITNGINADLVVTAVRTDQSQRHGGLSLLVVERGMGGFERGRNLEKIGLHAQDTAELFFTDVRVPVENLLGEEGCGFRYLTANLPQERLSIAVAAISAARAAVEWTLEYVKERTAFGRPIGSFQNTRFELATASTAVEVTQAYVDSCIAALVAGELSPEDAARAKWWATDVQGTVVDRCLQLFGGYGYMLEYPIARAYTDARASRIYGGSNEIMKEIVGRSLGL
jgi:alkylation response protein AidB-like acyl-CoA dehydrogenase